MTFYTGDPDTSSGAAQGAFPFTGPRHVAFIGGGFRVFDTTYTLSSGTVRDISPLLKPDFLAIDIETGQNLFRYVWPYLLNGLGGASAGGFYPSENRGTSSNPYYVPYAMSDPLVLDLWNENLGQMGDDGLHDHIYVGDLHGNFYSMKFHSWQCPNPERHLGGHPADTQIRMIPTTSSQATRTASSDPALPSPSPCSLWQVWTRTIPTKVRVIFGTGKYDDIEGTNSDKEDATKMSIYNLGDTINLSQNMPLSTPDFRGSDRLGFQLLPVWQAPL